MTAALKDVVKALFGDLVDPDAFGKMMPDASSVHVPGVLVTARVAPRKKTPGATVVRKTGPEIPGRRQRAVTAGLSAVGAAAGTGGLAYAAHDALKARKAGVKLPLKTKALIPLEVAGLGGELMATRILHADAKRGVGKGLGTLVDGHLSRLKMLNHAHDPEQRWATFPKAPAKGPKHLRTDKAPKASPAVKPNSVPPTGKLPGLYDVKPGEGSTKIKQGFKARGTVNDALSTTGGKVAVGAGVGGVLYGRHKAKQNDYYGKSVSFEATGTFAKLDEDKRLAFGWANVSKIDGRKVLDRQGDYIDIEDMEDAAYVFVTTSRIGGDMHRRTVTDEPHKVSDLVESMVFTPEKISKMGLPADFPQGWWVGFRYHDDEAWDDIKTGRKTGFSVHGKGIRKAMELEELYS